MFRIKESVVGIALVLGMSSIYDVSAAPESSGDAVVLTYKKADYSDKGMVHKGVITNWISNRSVSWKMKVKSKKKSYLSLNYSAVSDCDLVYEISGVGEKKVRMRGTGGWQIFRTGILEQIELAPGDYTFTITNKGSKQFIRLKNVTLSAKVPPPFSEEFPCVYTKKSDWVASMLAMRKAFDTPAVEEAQIRCGTKIDLYLSVKDGQTMWNDFPKETDWFLQDNQVNAGKMGRGFYDARQDFENYLNPDRDTTLEQKLIAQVLPELGSQKSVFKSKLDKLVAAKTVVDSPAWLNLYLDACKQRRIERLKPLIAKTDKLVYATHMNLGTIYLATETQGCPDGSELRVIDLSPELEGQPLKDKVLFDSKNGIVRDPEISFDGKKMLFAWRKTNENVSTRKALAPETGNYKIYEMDLATRDIRQLTSDETYGADFEPCYLPDGNIMFSSQRVVHEVTCGWGDCSNMFLMDKDGNYQRRVGYDQTQSAFPHLLDDGRVVFTRRDYNDRGQSYGHCVMVMNPDGTKQTEYYGNNSAAPTSIQHLRQIPGTRKTMGIGGGYHTSQGGKLLVIDPTKGTQNYDGIEFLNWEPTPPEKVTHENFCRVGEQYSHPYPMSERGFLVSYDPMGAYLTSANGVLKKNLERSRLLYKLYYMTLDGQRELLAINPVHSCTQAVPIMERKRPTARTSTVDYTKDNGVCYVQNVYFGPSAEGIKPGSIKKLRVVKLFYKPVTIGAGVWGPPRNEVGPMRKYAGYGNHSVLPTGVGTAAWDTKQILGEVDVHEDGSVMFEVPARTPVYFQLIDGDGHVAQTMRSWATLMPNETFSCVGCHEENGTAPQQKGARTTAMSRRPQKLQPLLNVSDKPFSYVNNIQPILDKHCVTCHASGKEAEEIDLTSTIVEDYGKEPKYNSTERKFFQSYLTLLQVKWKDYLDGKKLDEGRSNEIVNYWTRMSKMELIPPYYAGSIKSKLPRMLRKGHGKTKITEDEIRTISAWIDLNVPFVGEYDEMNIWSPDEKDIYDRKMSMRRKQIEIENKEIKKYIDAGQPTGGAE